MELVKTQQNQGFMDLSNFDSAMKFAEIISKSAFCPKQFMGKPGEVLVSLQFGLELGLKPLQALQNIAVINGKPSIYGDAALALCKNSPDYEYVIEAFEDIKGVKTAVCRAKRKCEPEEAVRYFSVEDAKTAKLWGKMGPWTDYPDRMLQMRARGFALRDVFPHVLKGFITVEEAQDYPSDKPQHKVTNHKPKSNVIDINPEPVVKEVELPISQETYADLTDIIEGYGIEEERVNKWLAAAGVSSINSLTENQGNILVEKLFKQYADNEEEAIA